MENEDGNNKNILPALAKDVYKDVVHPAAENTGKVLALLPQAIYSVLLPLRKWILYRDAQFEAVEQLLAKKLETVPPDQIVPPEPHVAVPALNAISYSMDSEELRNMYANLLSSSMSKGKKEYVHPSYVEIIKQLSPDEARIIRFMESFRSAIPAIKLREDFGNNAGGVDRSAWFTQLYKLVTDLEVKDEWRIAVYVDNLVRLQLLRIPDERYLVDEQQYVAVENDPIILSIKNSPLSPGHSWSVTKGYIEMTVFGNAFCAVCIRGVR